jgi:hypothetical protein
MGPTLDQEIYLCPNCLTPGGEPGACPECGHTRVGCRPGDPDDPCRRPLMDANGKLRTRAPLWWLQYTVRDLTKYLREQE